MTSGAASATMRTRQRYFWLLRLSMAALLPAAAEAAADQNWWQQYSYEGDSKEVMSCGELQDDGRTPNGLSVRTVSGKQAICDLKTDGGGWTLVASGTEPPGDYGGEWYPEVTTLKPKPRQPHSTTPLWYQDRLSAPVSDMRFSCSTKPCEGELNCTYTADLIFYETPWYPWIASATRRVPRCFAAQRVHPKRCDMLRGTCMERWVADEALQNWGEELCDEWGDDGRSFHIDYRWGASSAMAPVGADELDDELAVSSDDEYEDGWAKDDVNTEWGIVNGVWRCGQQQCRGKNATLLPPVNDETTASDCAWFVWVRGPPVVVETLDPAAPVPEEDVDLLTDFIFYLVGGVLACLVPVRFAPAPPVAFAAFVPAQPPLSTLARSLASAAPSPCLPAPPLVGAALPPHPLPHRSPPTFALGCSSISPTSPPTTPSRAGCTSRARASPLS